MASTFSPMTEIRFAPERIVAALNGGGVAYVIVGGIAVAAHGVVRATRDVDLVPEPSAANLHRLAATLGALGAEHPFDGTLTGSSLARPISFKLKTRHGEVQILNRMPAVPTYAQLRAAAISIDVGRRNDRHSLLPRRSPRHEAGFWASSRSGRRRRA